MHQLDKRGQDSSRTISTTSLPSKLRMLKTEGATSVQRLLKEELRMTIMAKRQSRGQGHLKVDFPEPQSHELTVAELERRERRREQNRRAAQRCRRKKRMNQMSVIQNYEWIITRNQQLEQELDRLRQERNQVQSLLKAHCQACTCAHALTTLLSPHGLDPSPPAVKVEPAEEPRQASRQAGFESLAAVSESWQYDDGALPPCSAASRGPQGCTNGQVSQPGSYPTTPFTTTTTSSSYHPPNDRPHHLTDSSITTSSNMNGIGEPSSASAQGAGTPSQQPVYSSLTSLVPAVPYSSSQAVQVGVPVPRVVPGGPSAFNLLDELAYMPGGLRSCVFQEEAATPLSADGRRSISSVSSDVSAMSEHPGGGGDISGGHHDEPGHLPVGDFYVTDDVVTSSDVSQLLSQINQSDLIFQQDEVFSESVVTLTSLPEHFLQNL